MDILLNSQLLNKNITKGPEQWIIGRGHKQGDSCSVIILVDIKHEWPLIITYRIAIALTTYIRSNHTIRMTCSVLVINETNITWFQQNHTFIHICWLN